MAIYMEVPKAKGSVTASGYETWIELDSMQFGVGRSVSMVTGNMANRSAGLPNFSEITVSKETDDSTYGLLNEAVLGAAGQTIKIAVVEPGDKPTEYVLYTLENAIFSSFSMSAAGSRPHESASISYAKLTVTFTKHDQAGKASGSSSVIYDLAKGTK